MRSRFFLSLLLLAISAEPSRADELTYLAHGNEALADLYTKIRDADHEIDMTYYIFDFCNPMTLVLMKQLKDKIAAKKAEGKEFRARILVDGSADVKSKNDALFDQAIDAKSTAAYYKQFGIDIRFYNQQVDRDKPLANFRTHLKLTVADGKRMVTGGRNIEPDYYGLSEALNWIDRDVSVEGAQAAQAASDFDELWNSKHTYAEGPPKPAIYQKTVERCFSKWNPKEIRIDDYLKANADKLLTAIPKHQCDDVSYIMDKDFGFRYMMRMKTQPTTTALVDMLSSAEESITMENYDYLPSSGIRTALAKQRTEIPIDTFTNNFQKSDEPVAWPTAERAEKDSTGLQTVLGLSQLGSMNDRWELTPASGTYMIHSKVYETDGKNVAVSTANLDPRSYHSNLESALMVRNCPAFAQQVRETTLALKKFVNTDSVQPCLAKLDVKPSAWMKVYYALIQQLL